MVKRLVVPKALSPIILRSLHFGHPGRDSMLAIVANVWWPNSRWEHWTAFETKSSRPTTKMQWDKLRDSNRFRGPNSKCKRRLKLYVSFHRPLYRLAQRKIGATKQNIKTDKVIEFLKKYNTRHAIPKSIRTDPATKFRSRSSKDFCRNRITNHVKFSIRDHWGNGEIERLIRTINERLRTNEKLIVSMDK